MEIRTFKKVDVVEVANLVRQMAEHHHALDAFYKSGEEYSGVEEMVGSWLDNIEMQLFISEEGGKISGYIRIGIEDGPEYSKEKKIGIVYDSFVAEEARRQGIASSLCESAIAWFKKKKARFVELNVDARNNGAVEFWKNTGFETVKFRMRKKIS